MTEQIARTPKQIGAAIRRHRRALGINQKAVGEKTHLRQATISGLEAGEAGIQLRTLFGVLTALNLELVVRPRTKASTDKIEEMF
ncbi:MAG: helix-turn-helix transcriptional regulator [Gammaproteobacteria bacterium]|nr:helix-turn-helix transcriptional regulator [Gammaproteobacteria bacterium]